MQIEQETIVNTLRNAPENAGLPDSEGRPAVAVVTLGRGQSAWNPASSKPERSVLGPATVTYRLYIDGAVEAAVSEGG